MPKRKASAADLEYLPDEMGAGGPTDANNILPELGKLTQNNYSGPGTVHVVMLRVVGEESSRPTPQAAFFSREKAVAFALRIFTAWCDSHYADYSWRGPDEPSRHHISRYTAFDSQTGQRLVTADAVTVSIFDAKNEDTVVDQAASTAVGRVNDAEASVASTGESQEGGHEKPLSVSMDTAAGGLRVGRFTTAATGGWREEVDKKVMKGANSD